jgi:hypothetical protein
MWRRPSDRAKPAVPDLQTQYEELLDTVWRCEREARLDDQIALVSHLEQVGIKRGPRR